MYCEKKTKSTEIKSPFVSTGMVWEGETFHSLGSSTQFLASLYLWQVNMTNASQVFVYALYEK